MGSTHMHPRLCCLPRILLEHMQRFDGSREPRKIPHIHPMSLCPSQILFLYIRIPSPLVQSRVSAVLHLLLIVSIVAPLLAWNLSPSVSPHLMIMSLHPLLGLLPLHLCVLLVPFLLPPASLLLPQTLVPTPSFPHKLIISSPLMFLQYLCLMYHLLLALNQAQTQPPASLFLKLLLLLLLSLPVVSCLTVSLTLHPPYLSAQSLLAETVFSLRENI